MMAIATYTETAAALKMHPDAVRKTEIRALSKLRRNKQLREIAKQTGLMRPKENS